MIEWTAENTYYLAMIISAIVALVVYALVRKK